MRLCEAHEMSSIKSNGATGRASAVHKLPKPLPSPHGAFAFSRSLKRPLLFCAGLVATGVFIKVVGMNLVIDFISYNQQRQDEINRRNAEAGARKWAQAMKEDEA